MSVQVRIGGSGVLSFSSQGLSTSVAGKQRSKLDLTAHMSSGGPSGSTLNQLHTRFRLMVALAQPSAVMLAPQNSSRRSGQSSVTEAHRHASGPSQSHGFHAGSRSSGV